MSLRLYAVDVWMENLRYKSGDGHVGGTVRREYYKTKGAAVKAARRIIREWKKMEEPVPVRVAQFQIGTAKDDILKCLTIESPAKAGELDTDWLWSPDREPRLYTEEAFILWNDAGYGDKLVPYDADEWKRCLRYKYDKKANEGE